jgi:proline iminopeptidase
LASIGRPYLEDGNLAGLYRIEVTCSPEAWTCLNGFSSKPFMPLSESKKVSGSLDLIIIPLIHNGSLNLSILQNYINHFYEFNLFIMKKVLFSILSILSVFCGSAQSFPDSEKDGKYYMVNGAKLWVVSFGKGDPLIVIPGGPGGAHPSYRAFDSLALTSTMVYFDAFGRGKSDTAKDLSEYTLARDIEDIEGLRKAMHFEQLDILGHSYGGVVAQGYALKYPGHVKHLILANTFHSFVMWQENDDNTNREIKANYPEVWDSLMKLRDKGFVSSDPECQQIYGQVPYGFLYSYSPDNLLPKKGIKYYYNYPNPNNTRLYYQMVGKDGDFIVGSDIGSFDYRKRLKDLTMPVLIYGGRYDRVAVPWMMEKFKIYCPQAQFVMFEFSGHNPQIEEPQKDIELIREFLKK